ncbi:DoxX family protein [Arenibacter palladensis]|uniref:DoxX family protein n=1 Tax=Arenibacter palladensis TaxID=237373 RepID=UPI0026E12ABF|nr:DoxX family protein [Arenibacter palladensis]MDO6604328.1 DoxX family protein [Arenibacter palladensis]
MDNVLNYPTELLLLLFLIITFLQSALDKILDWKGNLSWLKSHFSQTPFKNMVPLLLGTVMVTEIVAGLLCTIGLFLLIVQGDGSIALAGAILACLALLMLLLGQRMAKDYDGARTIAIYFMPAIFLVFLLHS